MPSFITLRNNALLLVCFSLLVGCSTNAYRPDALEGQSVFSETIVTKTQEPMVQWETLPSGDIVLGNLKSRTSKPLFVVDPSNDFALLIADAIESQNGSTVYFDETDAKILKRAQILNAELTDVQLYKSQTSENYSIKSTFEVNINNRISGESVYNKRCLVHYKEQLATLTHYTENYGANLSDLLLSHANRCAQSIESNLRKNNAITQPAMAKKQSKDSRAPKRSTPSIETDKYLWSGFGVMPVAVSGSTDGPDIIAFVADTYGNVLPRGSSRTNLVLEPAMQFSSLVSLITLDTAFAFDLGVNAGIQYDLSDEGRSNIGLIAKYRNNPFQVILGNPSLGYSEFGIRYSWKNDRDRWSNISGGLIKFWDAGGENLFAYQVTYSRSIPLL